MFYFTQPPFWMAIKLIITSRLWHDILKRKSNGCIPFSAVKWIFFKKKKGKIQFVQFLNFLKQVKRGGEIFFLNLNLIPSTGIRCWIIWVVLFSLHAQLNSLMHTTNHGIENRDTVSVLKDSTEFKRSYHSILVRFRSYHFVYRIQCA